MKELYLSIALVIALVSCTQTESMDLEDKLEATVESVNAISRIGFDKNDNWSFFWHTNDQIWVNGGIMTTSAANKSKTADFTGYGVNTESGYAVYPFVKAENNVTGTQLTWEFPSSYSYTNIDSDFFDSPQEIPMYAIVEKGKATFKHLGAILAIKMNDWTFTGKHVFTLTSSKKITGQFSTNLSGTLPVLEATTEAEDVVTITYERPSNVQNDKIVFYVPIPTGTYTLQPKIAVENIPYYSPDAKEKTVKRGDIVWIDVYGSSLDGGM